MDDIERRLIDVIPAARQGDRQALQQLIALIHPLVVRYCRGRIGQSQNPPPDDVAQEICLAVATSMSRYVDQGRPFMAYVYGIASHKVADAHRSNARDRANPVQELPEQVDQEPGPEDWTLSVDGGNRMRRLLDTLSDKAREIIILRVVVGLSAEETAQLIGSTPGAVRVAQHRALSKLRAMVESQAQDWR